jgi:DNA-directed RNA polymerase subunit RPC12/RpoP
MRVEFQMRMNPTTQPEDVAQQPKITYICGTCGNDVALGALDVVRCRNCAGRIVYKTRPKNKAMTYEAR